MSLDFHSRPASGVHSERASSEPDRAQASAPSVEASRAPASKTCVKWSDDEIRRLKANYQKHGVATARMLPTRSKSAIYAKVQELGLQRAGRNYRTVALISEDELSTGLGVSAAQLASWVRTRGLQIKDTDSGRVVHRSTLCRWLGANADAVNLARVDKNWFFALAFHGHRDASQKKTGVQ